MAKFEVVKLAPNIKGRLAWADEDKSNHRKRVEKSYPIVEGSYTVPVREQKPNSEIKRENPFDLLGREVFLYKIIANKLFEESFENVIYQRPIICLDFGGMFGATWIRLAKWFEKKVKSEQIVFIVTNLATTKKSLEKTYHCNLKSEEIYNDDGEVFGNKKARGLVRYIQADARELWETTIVIKQKKRFLFLPKIIELNLLQNVDVINEDFVFSWDKIPELDWYILLRLLHCDGVLMTGNKDSYFNQEKAIEAMQENIGANKSYSTPFSNEHTKVIFRDEELEAGICKGDDGGYKELPPILYYR